MSEQRLCMVNAVVESHDPMTMPIGSGPFALLPLVHGKIKNKLRAIRECDSGENACRQDLSFDQLSLMILNGSPMGQVMMFVEWGLTGS